MPFKVEERFEIHAPIERVWEILINNCNCEWNPFLEALDVEPGKTVLDVGAKIYLSVKFPNGSCATSTERVVKAEHPLTTGGSKRAEWAYEYDSIYSTLRMVTSMRNQILTQEPGGPTIYTTKIQMQGWALAFAPTDQVKLGLMKMGEALKATAEAT